MKKNRKPVPAEAPQSLIDKLKSYAKENLTNDERTILNAVFSVFTYVIEHSQEVFKGMPEFLKDISNAAENIEKPSNDSDPDVHPTTTIITTIWPSHPLICHSKEF